MLQKIIHIEAEFFLSSPYNYRESRRSEKSAKWNPPRRYCIRTDFVTYTPVRTGISTWGTEREGKPKAEQSWARHALLAAGEFTLLIIKEKYFNLFHKHNHGNNWKPWRTNWRFVTGNNAFCFLKPAFSDLPSKGRHITDLKGKGAV